MKRILWSVAAGLVTVAVGSHFGSARQRDDKNDPAYLEQLRLARAEGLPTTPAEFMATVKSVPESENAAPFYKKLAELGFRNMPDLVQLDQRLLFEPGQEGLREAKDTLTRYQAWSDLIGQATAKPHCWFDRDWTLGPAILFPELAYGKNAARLLLLRGSLAALEGRPKDALQGAEKALSIARHLNEEPLAISRLSARAVYDIAVRELATWSFRFRSEPAYYDALQDVIANYPKLDLQAEYRYELVSVLALLDLCDSKEGREMLGLRPEDLPSNDKIFTPLQSRAEGRVKIGKGVRMQWAAVKNPKDQYGDRLTKASSLVYQGLLSFLTAAKVYEAFDSGGTPGVEPMVYDARLMIYKALLRALKPGPVPKTIPTKDLISPLDGKPIRYRFDVKQIVLDAGQTPEAAIHVWLKLPPDKPKAR